VSRGYSWIKMDHCGVSVASFVQQVRAVVDNVTLLHKTRIFLKTGQQLLHLVVLFAIPCCYLQKVEKSHFFEPIVHFSLQRLIWDYLNYRS
jgi:hypothetical protein